MHMVVGGLLPARLTYIGVRAIDDFGNQSPIGPPVSATTRGMRFAGRVIDTVTGQGIPGARVTFGATELIADQDGAYQFVELGPGDGVLAARDETDAGIGGYFDYDMPYTVHHDDVMNLYLLPNVQLQTTFYTDFLQFFRKMTDVEGIPYPAQQRRRNLPIGLYARPFTKGGLDYAQAIREVGSEFDQIIGLTVFIDGTSLPPERVETTYSGLVERDRYGVTVWSTDWYPLVGLIEFRTVYTLPTVEAFKVTVRHEMGHSLGLGHSLDTHHLMVGGPAPSVAAFSADEVAVLRSIYRIPRGWDNRRYLRE